VFTGDTNLTVYYLPGTTGWGSTLGGCPAVQLASVTVQTAPAGLSFAVDGTNYSTEQTLDWVPGSGHTISATSTQDVLAAVQCLGTKQSDGGETALPEGVVLPQVQYIWTNWSDG